MRFKAVKMTVAALALAGLGSAAAFALPQPDKHPHPGTTSVTTLNGTSTGTGTVAAPPAPPTTQTHGHKPPKTGLGCKPSVSLKLKGTANADASPPTLQVNVTGGNHRAKPLFANHTSMLLTVTTNGNTKVRNGQGNSTSLSSIKKGDRVLVKFRDCKADLDAAKTAGTLTSLIQSPLIATMLVRLD
jgi:hypothetical protein